ncbi:hypothetical protein EBT31_07775 [bacterium]|nr:hypothetical protein [bacterium]NBX49324.1 hypothetical protein [bacterium]
MFRYLFAVGTILLVAVLHIPATVFDWYFYFWWYDVMMHFLGGVAAGFGGVALWFTLFPDSSVCKGEILGQALFVLGFVAIVGIAWEWSEAIIGSLEVSSLGMMQPGLTDTMLDFYFDLLGGAVAWLLAQLLLERKMRSRSM